jgi:biopolymer transport protein ExbB/biopolymer transport protein TolQ
MNIQELYEAMGPVAKAIFFCLIIMSIWSFGVFFERLFFYRAAAKQSTNFLFSFQQLIEKTDFGSAESIGTVIDHAQKKQYASSHVAAVLVAGLKDLENNIRAGADKATGHDVFESSKRAIERQALITGANLKKGLTGLATIGSTAPFIGLLGTVVGVINAFSAIGAAGAGGLGTVSKGISEALIETAVGLFVAIPAVWMYNAFTGKVERFEVEMTNASSSLVAYMMQRRAIGR